MAPESQFRSQNPGRDCQAIGTARFLGLDENPDSIHADTWAVIGNRGDSQCYLGVKDKVDAIQRVLSHRVKLGQLPVRLLDVNFMGGVSDGQLNGTERMRFSLVGRETTNDAVCLHLSGSDVKGTIAVVACDKPPVGTLAAILEHNEPSIVMSDGSIRPGIDPDTKERIDIVSGFLVAGDTDEDKKAKIALHSCPGYGSCGGMFTYNTMQSFIATLGMEPLHMVSPASEDPRRRNEFPGELVDYLQVMTEKDIKPRDIVTPASLRNAMIVAMAIGGSTNVLLHGPELARAAGLDWREDVLSREEFNALSRKVPVLTNARPYGEFSMVDIDENGGLQVVVKELLEGGAVIKVAGIEGGVKDGIFEGKARTFDSEQSLLTALSETPEIFQDKDIVVIRYEGPKGAPGMPEMLDPTSRISTLCRDKNITIALMTDARFSGGSVGLVVGHVTPEAYDGGPIALVEDGDTIVIDLNRDSIDCVELDDNQTRLEREVKWIEEYKNNNGIHPLVKPTDHRLLNRMRYSASTALEGAGMRNPQ